MPRTKDTRNLNGRSSIYLGGDGYWHGRVTIGTRDDGKPDRRHTMSKDKQKVVAKVKEWEKERDAGKVRAAGSTWTVETWLTHWVENIAAPTVRPNTLVGYRVAVYNHLVPGIGAHRLEKLRPEHLERLYAKLSEKRTRTGTKLKAATIHQVHRTVRTALAEAVRRHHLTSNPASIAKAPRIADEEIIPFTKEEAAKLLRAAGEMRNGARFVIALTLGLRKGEALGLQWRDVDLDAQTITIRRSVQRLTWQHGCPVKEPCGHRYAGHCPQRHSGGVVAAEVKSRAGTRTVGIPSPLVEVLRQHSAHQERERDRAADLWVEQGWVFTNHVGRPVHPRVDHNEWKALLRKAGVRDARLHDARHTAATMLLLLGVPSRAVMDVMGWSQASMTTRYQHVTPELTRSIANQVGELFWTNDRAADDEDDAGALVPA
jgi:integrase